MKKIEKDFIIKNLYGLHIRPSTAFSKTARSFKSTIHVKYKDKIVDGKSLLSLLSLGVGGGDKITIIAEGEDASEAIESLGKLIDNCFGLTEEDYKASNTFKDSSIKK